MRFCMKKKLLKKLAVVGCAGVLGVVSTLTVWARGVDTYRYYLNRDPGAGEYKTTDYCVMRPVTGYYDVEQNWMSRTGGSYAMVHITNDKNSEIFSFREEGGAYLLYIKGVETTIFQKLDTNGSVSTSGIVYAQ